MPVDDTPDTANALQRLTQALPMSPAEQEALEGLDQRIAALEATNLTVSSSTFVSSAPPDAVIGELSHPFDGAETYTSLGTVPPQIRLVENRIVRGSGVATAGADYALKVRCTSADGARETATTFTLSVVGTSVPAAPAFTVTPGPNTNIIAWADGLSGNSPILRHHVYRSTVANFVPGPATLIASPAGSGPFADNTAVNGTRYFYRITAVNATGESAYSAERYGTPAPAAIPAVGLGPTLLRPPALVDPITIQVTDDYLADNPTIYTPPGDVILTLQKNTPLTRQLKLQGNDLTRHIVMIGGEIAPAPLYDPVTMMLLDRSDYAVYTRHGFAFTGTPGGTFTIRLHENTYVPGVSPAVTAPIAWDAGTDTIKAAIEAVLGAGSVFAVAMAEGGPAAPGGPWKFVPSDARMGRVTILPTGLTGGATLTSRSTFYSPTYDTTCTVDGWTGTFHVEGLLVSGDYAPDGFNPPNNTPEARLHLVNCDLTGKAHLFHDDWLHPDGSQFYSGPTSFFAENTKWTSYGGNGFIDQARQFATTADAGHLRDWWFRNCQMVAYRDDRDPTRAADASSSLYRTETYSVAGLPRAWRKWDTAGTLYLNKKLASTGQPIPGLALADYYTYNGSPLEAEIVPNVGFDPPTPIVNNAGRGYVAPARTGALPGYMTKRYPVPELDPFYFAGVADVEPNTVNTSAAITIGGLPDDEVTGQPRVAPIFVTGGEYQVNGGAWVGETTSTSAVVGEVKNGDTVRVRATASAYYFTQVDVSLQIGAQFASYRVKTRPIPAWTPVGDAAVETWLDPSDETTVTKVAGAFTQVNDKSGNGHNLITRTGGDIPVGEISGRQAMLFAANRRFSTAAYAHPAEHLTFVAFQPDSVASGTRHVSSVAQHSVVRTNTATAQAQAYNEVGTVVTPSAPGALTIASPAVIGLMRDSKGAQAWHGTSGGIKAASAPSVSVTAPLTVGGTTSSTLIGRVGEFIRIDIAGMTDAQIDTKRQQVIAWLQSRWAG